MFTSLSTIGRFSRQSNHFRLSTLLPHNTTPKSYTYITHRSFGHFFKHKEKEEEETTRKEEPSKKKKTFLQSAKQAFFEGFLKGSDFNRMEKSIILREGKTYEEAAENYFSQAQYQKALENYKIALRLLKDGLGETDPELAYYIGRVGDIYYEVKEWDHAFNSYKESLELLEDSPIAKDEQVARLYFRAAMCCSKGNRYGETVDNMKQALKYYSRGRKSDMRDTVMISCNTILAECYTSFGQYNKALEYMEQAIETLERTDTSDGVDLPMAQHSLNYGLILAYANKDYKKAFKYMMGHQKAQIKMNGPESFTAGMSYLRIGDVYSLQGKYTEALDCYKKALQTLEKKVGTSDRRVGMCHKAIGQLYGIQGDYKEAVKETKKGLECFEEENFEQGQCYRNLAFAYGEMKKEDLAVENLKKSLDTRERMLEGFKEGDPELMMLNGLLVGMLYNKGDYAEMGVHMEGMMKEVCKIIAEK